MVYFPRPDVLGRVFYKQISGYKSFQAGLNLSINRFFHALFQNLSTFSRSIAWTISV